MTRQSFVEDLREERDRLRVQSDKLARRVGWMERLFEQVKAQHPSTRKEIDRSLNALAVHIEKEFAEGEG